MPSAATLVRSFFYDLAKSEVDLDGRAFDLDEHEPAREALRRIWSNPADDLPTLKSLTFDELSAMYRVYARNTRALLRYAFTAEVDLPVQVIEAVDGLCGPARGYLRPLSESTPGFAATHSLPGNHFTLLDLQTAPMVAELL